MRQHVLPVFDHVAAGPLVALGLEGTAPVSPTVLYSAKRDDRVARQHLTRSDTRIAKIVQQNVTRNISVIDVDPNDYEKNKFYKSIVEFIVPTSSGIFSSPKLRELGFASPHYVFSQTNCSGAAGCSPKEIASNDFKLTPIYSLNTAQGDLFDFAREDVFRNTLPMRSKKQMLTADELNNMKANLENLKSLESLKIQDSDRNHTTRSLVTLASLVAEGGLKAFVKSLEGKKGSIGVSVDRHPITGLMCDATGADVAEFVCVNITALVH